MQHRKTTAWRKSRTFGDVYGGRRWPKLADRIRVRLHSLPAPSPGQVTPILLEDNPSRDFCFPLSGDQVLHALQALPADHVAGITHVWLRRIKTTEYQAKRRPLAEFLCGSGVRAIVLYPWPSDLTLRFGAKRPTAKLVRTYALWTEDWVCEQGAWSLRWTREALRRFYIEHLLLHEVGHHLDQYSRAWSKANTKQAEAFADQYAVYWSQQATQVFSFFEASRTAEERD